MADPTNKQIKKVHIADLGESQDGGDLDQSQLEDVSGGGGGYGACPSCGCQPCACGG